MLWSPDLKHFQGYDVVPDEKGTEIDDPPVDGLVISSYDVVPDEKGTEIIRFLHLLLESKWLRCCPRREGD